MQRVSARLVLCCLAIGIAGATLLLPTSAWAGGFARLPDLDGGRSPLQVRFVRYTGGSTGRMVVDVRNPTQSRQVFDARGVFFVPAGDPERAPQRLGAAGPFEVDLGNGQERRERLLLAPGKTHRVHLQVFCLDSHRASPSSTQAFRLSKARLPKELRREIAGGAQKLYKRYAAKPRAAQNSQVQSHVWTTRNKKWIALEGERKNEKAAKSERQQRRYQQLRPIRRRQLVAPTD